MPLATILGEMLKSGKVTVSANNVKALEIEVVDKKIEVKALNKKFVKDTFAAARGTEKSKGLLESMKGSVGQIKTARSNIIMLRGVAEELSQAGVTLTLSYKGNVVVTVGSQANPKLSSIATGTKAIEINSPRKLIELGI